MSDTHAVRVSRDEHDLLDVARALIDHGEFDAVASILRGRGSLGSKIAPPAMHVLRDILQKGVVHLLMRSGGARRRIWSKATPPKILFSRASFELLHWLVSTSLASAKPAALDLPTMLTFGDEILVSRTMLLVEGSELETLIASESAVRRSSLAWIFSTVVLGARGPCPLDPAEFEAWTTGDGATILDALSDDLARRVALGERRKRTIVRPDEAIAIGRAQEAVLGGLLDGADKHQRRDIATFLVDTARSLLPPTAIADEVARQLTPHLDPSRPLGERTEGQRRAGALIRAISRVGRWHEEHRAVRFVDDEYEQAQRLLTRWEAFGRDGFGRADDVVRAIEALALS